MSNIQTGAERMPHDLSHLGFLAGQIGRLITISTTPVIARIFLMSRKIILIKQELLLLVYELNRSGLLAENEKIRPILAQLEKLLLCDLSPSTNDSVKN